MSFSPQAVLSNVVAACSDVQLAVDKVPHQSLVSEPGLTNHIARARLQTALSFLVAACPDVEFAPHEVPGPGWPAADDLAALHRQVDTLVLWLGQNAPPFALEEYPRRVWMLFPASCVLVVATSSL